MSKHPKPRDLPQPGLERQDPLSLVKGTWDDPFGYLRSIEGGAIYAMLEVGDSLFIAGDFSEFKGEEAFHVILYNTKTGIITELGSGVTSVVHALAYHDGKLYAGGSFYYADDEIVNGFAVYEKGAWKIMDGGIPNNDVRALAIYRGQLVVGGYFTRIGNTDLAGIGIFDGTSWNDLNGGVRYSDGSEGYVETLCVKGDSLFVGGGFSRLDGAISVSVGLWAVDYWQELGTGVTADVAALEWFEDMLWIGGDFTTGSWSGVVSPYLIAWDGEEYVSVTGSDRFVSTLKAIGDTLYVGGSFLKVGDVKGYGIARYSAGTWTSIGQGVYGVVNALAEIDGRVFVGGNFTRAGGFNAESFGAFDHSTGAWQQGNSSGVTESYIHLRPYTLANTEDFLYVGGNFLRADDRIVNHIAAWNKKTRRWSAMAGGVDGSVNSIVVRGKDVFVGGAFNRAGTVETQGIAKWDELTSSWSSLGLDAPRVLDAVAVDANYVYASMYFDFADGNFLNNIGRWNGESWEPIPGAFRGFAGALHASNDRLYLGGNVFDLDGERMNNIAVLENGSWSPMGDGIDGRPSVIVTAHGRVYAAGAIDGNFDEEISGVMQFDSDVWSSLGGGVDDYVYGATIQGSSVYFGGWFGNAGEVETSYIAEWDGTTWDRIPGVVDYVVLTLTSDRQSVYLGGFFSEAGNTDSWRLAKFDVEQSSVAVRPESRSQVIVDPMSGQVTLLDADRSFDIVSVYDILGREIYTSPVYNADGQYQFTLPTGAKGTLIVRFTGEEIASIVIHK